MDPAVWVAAATATITLVTGAPFMAWQIRTKTADDHARAAEQRRNELRQAATDARTEEREKCQSEIRRRDDAIGELVADRNAERARADGLQKLINEWGRK